MSADQLLAVEAYADAVRSELADLAAAELDDLLDDVPAHLADVAAELGDELSADALVARLGTPAHYAAELRASAGLTPAGGSPGGRTRRGFAPDADRLLPKAVWAARIVVLFIALIVLAGANPYALGALATGVVAFVAVAAWARNRVPPAVAALPEMRRAAQLADAFVDTRFGSAAVPFALSLRPAWWMARALIAVNGLSMLVDDRRLAFPMPGSDSSAALMWVLLTAASVWLGLERRRMARWTRLVIAGNVGLAAAAFPIFASANLTEVENHPEYAYEQPPQDIDLSVSEVGGENLFVYDADGNLLTDVRIYDQDGNPIRVGRHECELRSGQAAAEAPTTVFPRTSWAFDPETGECVERGIVPPRSAKDCRDHCLGTRRRSRRQRSLLRRRASRRHLPESEQSRGFFGKIRSLRVRFWQP